MVLLNAEQVNITLQRLAAQLIEEHGNFEHAALIGIQPRGVFFSNRLAAILQEQCGPIPFGSLDITLYRDDLRQKGLSAMESTDIPFDLSGRVVILADDVLYTGRTVRAAMDALLDFGRPARVELVTLIDRYYTREVPVQPTYNGRTIDSRRAQRVVVQWKEQDGKDEVILVG